MSWHRLYRDRAPDSSDSAVFPGHGILLCQFLAKAPCVVFRHEALSEASGILCAGTGNDSKSKERRPFDRDAADVHWLSDDGEKRNLDSLCDSGRRVDLPCGVLCIWSKNDTGNRR